ncbi:MAG: hypothetical protein OEZ29_04045 [Candidatus Bathyarchaeota archaeon]|nr:hypothetical protein [Candidatus Bathyarchaeota archaeon]
MNEEKPKYPMKWIVVGVIIGIAIIASTVLFLVNRPRPEITLLDGHGYMQGLNYLYRVDVAVKNNGGGGWVTVHAEISTTGRYEKQDQRVYLDAGESKSLQYVFDISFWGTLFSSIEYSAWAVPD